MLRLLALLLCLPASAALACKCLPRAFADYVTLADQVFIGRAARVTAQGERGLFQVSQRFKGVLPDTLTIRSDLSKCSVTFEGGQTYVVFARAGSIIHCGPSGTVTTSDDIGKLFYTFRRSFADSLGRDAAPLLNSSEARYFDWELQQQRGSFSFQGKRVGFFIASTPARSDKQRYMRLSGGKEAANQLLVLTPAEKQQSGGYDALIVSWRKVLVSPGLRRRLVRRLKQPATT